MLLTDRDHLKIPPLILHNIQRRAYTKRVALQSISHYKFLSQYFPFGVRIQVKRQLGNQRLSQRLLRKSEYAVGNSGLGKLLTDPPISLALPSFDDKFLRRETP